MITIFKIFTLTVLNFFVISFSSSIDTYQLLEDLEYLFGLSNLDVTITYWIASISVSFVTMLLIKIFKPFIEIYLLHYSKYFFYVLVSLLSLSSVYIVLRVYGYSRLSIIIYIIISSIFLNYSGKIINFFNN
jgi:hypothetical protein